MSPETSATVQLLLRFFHIFFGIVWIGHLYFFNFVNVPFQGVLEKELKPRVNPPLILRALWWFRWGAMGTFIFGWLLFIVVYMMGGYLFDADGGLSRRGLWMLLGAILGTIMWFNVWFVIWPAQQKIIGGMTGGAPPAPRGAAQGGRCLFSRIIPSCPRHARGNDAARHQAYGRRCRLDARVFIPGRARCTASSSRPTGGHQPLAPATARGSGSRAEVRAEKCPRMINASSALPRPGAPLRLREAGGQQLAPALAQRGEVLRFEPERAHAVEYERGAREHGASGHPTNVSQRSRASSPRPSAEARRRPNRSPVNTTRARPVVQTGPGL